ncbi:hypothetical protein ACFX1Z_004868 [Malus domestica]
MRGRDLMFRDKSLRQRTRSLSPLRNEPFEWGQNDVIIEADEKDCNFAEVRKGLRKTGKNTKREWKKAAPPLLLLRFQLRHHSHRRCRGTQKVGFLIQISGFQSNPFLQSV